MNKLCCYNIEYYRKYYTARNWLAILHHHSLNEEMLREFKDKVIWDIIFRYQNIRDDFIRNSEYKN